MALLRRVRDTPARFGVTFSRGSYAVFAFLALCAIVTLVGSQDAADAAGALGVFTGALLAGIAFLRGARGLVGRERVGWSLIGLGMLFAASGVLTVGVLFFVQGDAPAFGWTDLFFLGTYVVVISGFALLPHTQGSALQRWRMVLDGLIGAVSVAALMWTFFLSDLMTDLADASVAARTIGAFYPFLDILAITVAMSVLLRRSRHRFDIRVAIFTVGIMAQVAGDLAFFISGHSGSFDDAEPLYVINLLAVGAYYASATLIRQPTEERQYADRNPPLWTHVAPYIPAVGMLAVFLAEAFVGPTRSVDPVLLGATIVVGLLVIARQSVAIVDNRTHVEQQRNALVSTISHELRTPLTAIVGFVDVVRDGGESMGAAERAEMLEVVQDQANYMSRIVSDLILLARDSDSELELDVRPVDICALVWSSVQASGVPVDTVTVDCRRDVVAFVDANRIQQVLVNLLTNAMRYGGDRRLVRLVASGSDLSLEVHDDGAGVPRRYEVQVWDRFDRGPNRLNATTPGSGIGLAIVRAIAEAHGGRATYSTSSLLGGACFAVELPGRAGYASTRSDRSAVRDRSVPSGS